MRHISFLIPFLFLSCEPGPDIDQLVQNMLVTTTYYGEKDDFSKAQTFYIPLDTLSLFSNAMTSLADTLQVSKSNKSFIHTVTQRLHDHFVQKGYKQTARKDKPDWFVYVFIVEQISSYQTYIQYPYGYGIYSYNAFSYRTINTTTSVSTLYVCLLDLKNLTNEKKPKLVWFTSIGDLDSSPNFIQKTNEAIDRSFLHSPYLTRL